jgi:hypothetical protein
LSDVNTSAACDTRPVRKWGTYEIALADLSALDAADRLPVLLEEWLEETLSLPYEDVRLLFLFAWDEGRVTTRYDHEVVRMLRWISPVRDSDARLFGPQTLYRPADGNENAIRWWLDPASIDGENGVLRTTVDASNLLAHVSTAGQVLVDPNVVETVERI